MVATGRRHQNGWIQTTTNSRTDRGGGSEAGVEAWPYQTANSYDANVIFVDSHYLRFDGCTRRLRDWSHAVIWWIVLLTGFGIASWQSFFHQTFNGASLFGLMLVLLAAGFILTKEIDK
jgi:hypothetical protein